MNGLAKLQPFKLSHHRDAALDSYQQTLGIIMFTYQLGVRKSSILKIVFDLQPLFDVAATKEFTDDLCSAFFIKHRSMHGRLNIPWEVEKFIANKMSQVSNLLSYDWWLKHQ